MQVEKTKFCQCKTAFVFEIPRDCSKLQAEQWHYVNALLSSLLLLNFNPCTDYHKRETVTVRLTLYYPLYEITRKFWCGEISEPHILNSHYRGSAIYCLRGFFNVNRDKTVRLDPKRDVPHLVSAKGTVERNFICSCSGKYNFALKRC